ncbi:hypothetical protein, partial [Aeromonas enteropelogenes]|uniref:hypothetical protein n=1 Tax=Aeromonas enteropelogenes TaxID=29489 RepID=UPI003BA20B59
MPSVEEFGSVLPRDLEYGLGDWLKGVSGSAVQSAGSLVSNLSLGDMARGTRSLIDPTMNEMQDGGAVDIALTWLNDTFDPEGKERQRVSNRANELQKNGSLPAESDQKQKLTFAPLPGLSALSSPLQGAEVVGDVADKAIRPAAKFLGNPIKEAGSGIVSSASPDFQEAMNSPDIGVVAQISQQVMTSPALGNRYTRGFLT